MTTLVYVDGKWVVQDATFNYTITDRNGHPFSIQEIMNQCANRDIEDLTYLFGDTNMRYVVYSDECDVISFEDFEADSLDYYPLYESDVNIAENYVYLSDMEQPGCFERQVENILDDTLTPLGYPTDLKYLFLFPTQVYGDDRRECDRLFAEIDAITNPVNGD